MKNSKHTQTNIQCFEKFVKNWSDLYSEKNEDLYSGAINKGILSEKDLRDLFVWRNGLKFCKIKESTFKKFIIHGRNAGIINKLRKDTTVDMSEFNKHFDKLLTVWKIFLLHIIKPEEFPVYDQNTHRAYNFIAFPAESEYAGINISDKEKENFYFDTYLKLIYSLKGSLRIKKVDEAMITLGKNLKNADISKVYRTFDLKEINDRLRLLPEILINTGKI